MRRLFQLEMHVQAEARMMAEHEKRVEIAQALGKFFAKEPYKLALWLMLENPNFGGLAPAELLCFGRRGLEKVHAFVMAAQEVNTPAYESQPIEKDLGEGVM